MNNRLIISYNQTVETPGFLRFSTCLHLALVENQDSKPKLEEKEVL